VTIRQVKVCLNGGRRRAEHPAVPLTPAELAMSARSAVEAGAEAVHVHPRADSGAESLLAADIGAAVGAIRRSCPGVPIGVSTGLWITSGDVWRREAQVAAWADLNPSQRPDFASVNLSEPGFAELVALLAAAGIGAEAGVWSVADARRLATAGRRLGWLRVLVEIVDPPADGATGGATGGAAVGATDGIADGFSEGFSDGAADGCEEDADLILAAVRASGLGLPVLLHGQRKTCWPLINHAGLLDLPTRIGLEDVLTGPTGEPIRDNAHLVALALHTWRTAGWDT
jgi:uncharacterized protein (DUF849 family)